MNQVYKLGAAFAASVAIATGELAPGSSLDEFSLAERHGVSRTPAREALIQLAAEGLIEIRPRRGAIVKSISPTRLNRDVCGDGRA